MTTTTLPEGTTLEALLGTVGEAMTGQVVLLDADMAADVAARRLERTGVSGAPVVRRGRLVGVVTLRDLLTRWHWPRRRRQLGRSSATSTTWWASGSTS